MTALATGYRVAPGDVSPAFWAKLLEEQKTVHLEPGEFTLDDTLVINERVHIVGSGADETVIRWRGAGPAFRCTQTGQAGGVIANLRILGNGNVYQDATPGSVGIQLGQSTGSPGSAQMHIEDVFIRGMALGIDAQASVLGVFNKVLFNDCTMGFQTSATKRSIRNLMTACRFERCFEGFNFRNGNDMTLIGCTWQYQDGRAVLIGQGENGATLQNLHFIDSYFENNYQTEDGTGQGAIKVDSAYDSTTRSIHFHGGYYTEDSADYHFEIGSNEGWYMTGFPAGEEIRVKGPSSGTPIRSLSPMRQAASFHSRAYESGYYDMQLNEDDDDLTPRASIADTVVLDYTTGGTVASFNTFNLRRGHRLRAWLKSANITLQHGTGSGALQLAGATNWTPGAAAVVEFELDASLQWVEMSRAWAGGGAGSGSPYP